MSNRSKEERIIELLEKGMTDPKQIARRLGFKGNAINKGIALINQVSEQYFKQGRML